MSLILRVASLNMAHGRGRGLHQTLQSRARIVDNLDAMAELLRRESVDLVCAQEADGASWWSGGIDHVAHLAKRGGFHQLSHAHHVAGFGLRYGTALLSRFDFEHTEGRRFRPSLPTPHKGFSVARVRWPGMDEGGFDLVSVHLDFSRARVRTAQVEEMVDFLDGRDRPAIIAGDFNAEWRPGAAPKLMAERLALEAWQPEVRQVTFPGLGGRRLDWVLASQEFEIIDQRVLEDPISDHHMLICDIRLQV